MSKWTHITACLSIDTGIEKNKPRLKCEIRRMLWYAPKITGSEEDAEFFVNIPRGYNTWRSEYDETTKRYKEHRISNTSCDYYTR